MEINESHVEQSRRNLTPFKSANVKIIRADYFGVEWETLVRPLADPLLIIGNPPWVTSSALARMQSSNLPQKSNFQSLSGIQAITGSSNFDISESMIISALEWMSQRPAVLAMLCKTAVARRVLLHIWQSGRPSVEAKIYNIDAAKHFDVAVDACLLVLEHPCGIADPTCRVYHSLESNSFHRIGYRAGTLIADLNAFNSLEDLLGNGPRWRSGIKHDCAKLMELVPVGGQYVNGFGGIIELEETYLYPMLKSSELANTARPIPSKVMLVLQTFVGENTDDISRAAPLTWKYLQANGELLDRRRSSIYRGKPRFSIFGIGDYSFSPWKVAVSGFYKDVHFRLIGPVAGRPVMLDDTCYFLSSPTRISAEETAELLNSQLAGELISSLIFTDAKRPVTAKLLQNINLKVLGHRLDVPHSQDEGAQPITSE